MRIIFKMGLIVILMSLLLSFLPLSHLRAWNEDYRPENIPLQRSVCVRKVLGTSPGYNATVRSIRPDEPCAPNEIRYTLVIGSNPKGSLALVPLKSYDEFYPPWVVTWPAREEFLMSPRLWHFTCFANSSSEVLGTVVKKRHFRGEITAPSHHQSCESAYTMANTVCSENLGGNEIMEQCYGIFGLFED